MANTRYQYETSPRKIEPDYKNDRKRKLKVIETTKQERLKQEKLKKEQKSKRIKQVCLVIVAFATLLVISYRNSLINEEFKVIQNQKEELATIEKANKQLEVSIESSLNLKNIEQVASEQLGMQKQTTEQTIYTQLPKEDYVEVSAEKIEENKVSLFEKILNLFK